MRIAKRILVTLAIVAAAALALPPLWFSIFPAPVPEMPPPGRRVEVRPGVGVNVIEAGEGPAVVLVHGHPGSAYDWSAVARELAARGHRAIAYDRVGYGHSDARPDGDFTVAANADELLGLLAAEDLRDVTLVGWSYGGGTAIAAARKDPSRIARLVLVGSVGPGIENRQGPPAIVVELLAGPVLGWLARVPPLASRVRAMITAAAFDPEPIAPGYPQQLDANFGRPATGASFRSEGRDLDGRADLDPGGLDLPILVIHGDGDLLVPPSVGEEIHRRAKRADLWVVRGGGHMLPITRPRDLAERMADFAAPPG